MPVEAVGAVGLYLGVAVPQAAEAMASVVAVVAGAGGGFVLEEHRTSKLDSGTTCTAKYWSSACTSFCNRRMVRRLRQCRAQTCIQEVVMAIVLVREAEGAAAAVERLPVDAVEVTDLEPMVAEVMDLVPTVVGSAAAAVHDTSCNPGSGTSCSDQTLHRCTNPCILRWCYLLFLGLCRRDAWDACEDGPQERYGRDPPASAGSSWRPREEHAVRGPPADPQHAPRECIDDPVVAWAHSFTLK